MLFLTEHLRRQPFNLFSCRQSACRHGERRSRPLSEGRLKRHLRTPGNKERSSVSPYCSVCYTLTALNTTQPLVFIFMLWCFDATVHPWIEHCADTATLRPKRGPQLLLVTAQTVCLFVSSFSGQVQCYSSPGYQF